MLYAFSFVVFKLRHVGPVHTAQPVGRPLNRDGPARRVQRRAQSYRA